MYGFSSYCQQFFVSPMKLTKFNVLKHHARNHAKRYKIKNLMLTQKSVFGTVFVFVKFTIGTVFVFVKFTVNGNCKTAAPVHSTRQYLAV
jgi:hypothetical protein